MAARKARLQKAEADLVQKLDETMQDLREQVRERFDSLASPQTGATSSGHNTPGKTTAVSLIVIELGFIGDCIFSRYNVKGVTFEGTCPKIPTGRTKKVIVCGSQEQAEDKKAQQ